MLIANVNHLRRRTGISCGYVTYLDGSCGARFSLRALCSGFPLRTLFASCAVLTVFPTGPRRTCCSGRTSGSRYAGCTSRTRSAYRTQFSTGTGGSGCTGGPDFALWACCSRFPCRTSLACETLFSL